MVVLILIFSCVVLCGSTWWWAHHCGFMTAFDEPAQKVFPLEDRQKELLAHNERS